MSAPSNYPRPHLNAPGILPCPNCGESAAKRVSYTWWGGAVGPALMHLHQCKACGYQFNAKTGLSAKKAIRIYRTAAWAIAGVALIGYFLSHR